MKDARSHIIGIRVNKDMENRLMIRAIRNMKSVSEYCYDLIHDDIYRKDKHKATSVDCSESSNDKE